MKNSLRLFTFLGTILPAGLYAQAKPASQTATVVSVAKYEAPSNYIGSPTDAPLQPTEYADDIGIRLGCELYVGRYESAIDYLPSAFTPNHSVDVRIQKHILYVTLSGDRELKMGIIRHSHLKDASCPANR
jgi:hypothetical protein